MRFRGILGGAALLFAATAAMAQAVSYDADYARYRPNERAFNAAQSAIFGRCIDRSGGVTVTMRDCHAAEYERIDAQLNAHYRRVMARLPRAQTQQLRASQRRWLATRWDRCDSGELDGGTLALIVRDSCTLNELTRRTMWLGRL